MPFFSKRFLDDHFVLRRGTGLIHLGETGGEHDDRFDAALAKFLDRGGGDLGGHRDDRDIGVSGRSAIEA